MFKFNIQCFAVTFSDCVLVSATDYASLKSEVASIRSELKTYVQTISIGDTDTTFFDGNGTSLLTIPVITTSDSLNS